MTAQIPETLLIDGRPRSMCTEPLNDYFALSGVRSGFEISCTALWRGYVGHWEIAHDRLYLLRIDACYPDGREAKLTDLFPEHPDRVFAHWCSGTLRIPEGRRLHYVHGGYGSTFERDRLIRVERGAVLGIEVRTNGVAKGATNGVRIDPANGTHPERPE
ncbi:hypothetical protein [Methyloversatilis universalis]|uniref:hypothetical protein n=1 Tax=Methyloversatilis universalis TaxID=378211 RepID=UPI0003718AF9|nr:hypothetical protein [Methyloversatilis universalis]